MASTELERSCGTVSKEEECRRSDIGPKNTSSRTKKKSKRKSFYVPKFGCFRLEQDDDATIGRSGNRESMDLVSDSAGARRSPTHLIVMVNGLVGRLVQLFMTLFLAFACLEEMVIVVYGVCIS